MPLTLPPSRASGPCLLSADHLSRPRSLSMGPGGRRQGASAKQDEPSPRRRPSATLRLTAITQLVLPPCGPRSREHRAPLVGASRPREESRGALGPRPRTATASPAQLERPPRTGTRGRPNVPPRRDGRVGLGGAPNRAPAAHDQGAVLGMSVHDSQRLSRDRCHEFSPSQCRAGSAVDLRAGVVQPSRDHGGVRGVEPPAGAIRFRARRPGGGL